jgi:nitroreductase
MSRAPGSFSFTNKESMISYSLLMRRIMKNLIESLNWRYATKKYDPTKKLSAEQIDMLLEAVRLAPTSFGLPSFRVFVVTNNDIRAKLAAAGYGQQPIIGASHFIIFAAKTNLSVADADELLALTSTTRNVPVESLVEYHQMVSGAIARNTPEQNIVWAAKQAYLALGVLLTAAALNEIDATPMEGFDPKGFNEILGLDKMNLTAVVCAAVGFRAADDAAAGYAKVRLPKDKLITEV